MRIFTQKSKHSVRLVSPLRVVGQYSDISNATDHLSSLNRAAASQFVHSTDFLLGLQQSHGNHCVQQMMRAKLTKNISDRILRQIVTQPKINYEDAWKANQRYASLLGWDKQLAEFQPALASSWNSGNVNEFIDAVTAFQVDQGFKGRAVDGVVGPLTWDRLRPIGEVIAAQGVSLEASKNVCTIATEERLKKGYKRATGEKLVTPEERSDFRIILQSDVSQLVEVDEKYRGTGAAGGLVYLGVGEFVSQDDIWNKRALKPGAAMQVWKKQSDLDNLKNGEAPKSWGTSFVFLKYEGDDTMKVLHYNRIDRMQKGDFEFWVGANLAAR